MMARDENTLEEERQLLVRCQNNLFIIGSYLAIDQSQTPLYDFAKLPQGETTLLEERIDQLMASLPEKQGFVLPGGTVSAAQCHICRTVCRRAERRILELAQHAVVGDDIICYVNRLSDYLFVLAKKINFNAGQSEIIWQKTCR
jgi:cob(I)alamin adenosyltransferase